LLGEIVEQQAHIGAGIIDRFYARWRGL